MSFESVSRKVILSCNHSACPGKWFPVRRSHSSCPGKWFPVRRSHSARPGKWFPARYYSHRVCVPESGCKARPGLQALAEGFRASPGPGCDPVYALYAFCALGALRQHMPRDSEDVAKINTPWPWPWPWPWLKVYVTARKECRHESRSKSRVQGSCPKTLFEICSTFVGNQPICSTFQTFGLW
jgi:hypothetical protein